MDMPFVEQLEIGETVPVYVITPSDLSNNLIVSINMGMQRYDWENAQSIMDDDRTADVRVTGYQQRRSAGTLEPLRRLYPRLAPDIH